ncbi:MAG: mycothiol synthase [Acidimicrobiales bacterium]
MLRLATEPPLTGVDAEDLDAVAARLRAAATDGRLLADGPDLLAEAEGLALAYRAEHLVLDAEPAAAAIEELAADTGFTLVREVLQMRRSLPLGETGAVATRPFRPGSDDAAWLELNNRAFAWHPEQGDWDAERLRATLAEPWVDLDGFLVLEQDHEMVGFCWTKVHADDDPPVGEIFVIAVDPDRHGRGLGRALTLAGLTHLADRGLTVGMLYVEASNAAARTLYRDLGFSVFDSHRWWSRPVT